MYTIFSKSLPEPCITNVFATRRNNFSQWYRSFQRKLLSHWLKFLRHVAITLVIQGPEPQMILFTDTYSPQWEKYNDLCRPFLYYLHPLWLMWEQSMRRHFRVQVYYLLLSPSCSVKYRVIFVCLISRAKCILQALLWSRFRVYEHLFLLENTAFCMAYINHAIHLRWDISHPLLRMLSSYLVMWSCI